MKKADRLLEIKEILNEVVSMFEEMDSHLSMLTEKQALWNPPKGKWPIYRSVTHCVNCEHRAVTELNNAINGKPTPETNPADTGIFAWAGPTPYMLARTVSELKDQISQTSDMLDPQHLGIKAVRYPKHPPRGLLEYVRRMHKHTGKHLEAIKEKLAAVPPEADCDPDIRKQYPEYGKGK